MTVKELREIAKNNGIKGYSRMRKEELENALADLASEEMVEKVVSTDNSIYSHKTTPADGQGLCSLVYGAYLACSLRIITENELDRFEEMYNKVHSIEELINNRSLMGIVNRIPKAFQVRHKHTGTKGMLVVFPLELVDKTKDLDVIITKGLSKYGNGSWNSTDIEICAYLKKKSEWVSLNVQFINALTNYEKPNFLLPIVDYWHNFAMSTLDNDIIKMKFHNIVSSFGDESHDDDLRLSQALHTNIKLKNERYIAHLAESQYDKFYADLKTGRMEVPGIYSYMLTDPMFILNQLYGTNLPELKSGEYWCNGKTCKAGLFRSPMIAPFEAQKVQLVSHKFFDIFYRNITLFNGHDGVWELMSGADFDGDTCACIPNDTELGKIIVDAIQDSEYVILHESKTAQEVQYNPETFWADLAHYNSTVARADRTGLITNHATKAIEMWHHLKSVSYYAKANGCTAIYMVHPNDMGRDDMGNIINKRPYVAEVNGERVFVIRGLVFSNSKTNFKWIEEYPTGRYSFEQIEELMHNFMLKVEYLNPVQGDEIDGAKTGYYPELFDAIEIAYQSIQTSDRNEIVGKSVSKTTLINGYYSYSPLSIVHDYAEKCEAEFKNAFENIVADKTSLLKNLLTEEEKSTIYNLNVNNGGMVMSFINYLKGRKTEYGNKAYEIARNKVLSEEEKMEQFRMLRDGADIIENGVIKHYKGEKEILFEIASALNLTEEMMASAIYIASNETDGRTSGSVRYAWILFDELLAVFARQNEQVTLYRIPAYTENISIANHGLFINGKKFANVDAEDSAFVPVQNINGKYFALIKKHQTSDNFKGNAINGKVYNTGAIVGFKYNDQSVENFKNAIVANNYVFSIEYDNDSNICAFVNGTLFGRLISANDSSRDINELIGHKVRITTSPAYQEFENSIKNMLVVVVE